MARLERAELDIQRQYEAITRLTDVAARFGADLRVTQAQVTELAKAQTNQARSQDRMRGWFIAILISVITFTLALAGNLLVVAVR